MSVHDLVLVAGFPTVKCSSLLFHSLSFCGDRFTPVRHSVRELLPPPLQLFIFLPSFEIRTSRWRHRSTADPREGKVKSALQAEQRRLLGPTGRAVDGLLCPAS